MGHIQTREPLTKCRHKAYTTGSTGSARDLVTLPLTGTIQWSADRLNLTSHFTLEEMTFSEIAAHLGVDNTPGPTAAANLRILAASMEEIRALLKNNPIVVHSAYRSIEVNTAVGGAATSAHCSGLACDFVCPAFGSAAEVAVAIAKSDVAYDQTILEYGWVHVGLASAGMTARREALTKRSPWATYELGIRV